MLAWRYLAAALLLVGIARPARCCASRSGPRSAPSRSARVVYALDSALFFGSLERTSAPLASLVHYAHLVLVVGVAAMIGRERLTRRRLLRPRRHLRRASRSSAAPRSNPDLRRRRDGARLGGRLRGLHPPLRPAPPRRRPDGARRLPHRRRGDVVPRRRRPCSARSARSAARPGSPASSARRSSARSSRSRSFLKGVRLVGPSTASLLVTVEVPVTIALAAVVLKQHLTPPQLVGRRRSSSAAIVAMQLRRRRRRAAQPRPHVAAAAGHAAGRG